MSKLMGHLAIQKNLCMQRFWCLFVLAEREGFEPPEHRCSTVFKTAAIDHSAIFPPQK